MTNQTTLPKAADSTDLHQVALTDEERRVVQDLVDRLVETPPYLLDDQAWLAAARQQSNSLPVRLREVLRDYRHDSHADGMVHISRLPINDAELPQTPNIPESVERRASAPAVVALLLGLQLAEVVAYRNEKAGALVQNIVPVPGYELTQSNAGSVPLELHVENAFHPNRPDYVGLLCLRDDRHSETGTLVASIRKALPLLSRADLRILQEARFSTAPPPSFTVGTDRAAHAILQGSPDDPSVCLDLNATRPLDVEAERTMKRLGEILMSVSIALALKPGEMAFLDNRIVLHGRSGFAPRYDGCDRWLHRVYVHLDNRRSRPHRTDNGSVMA